MTLDRTQTPARECAAARVALLAVTLLTAIQLHSLADSHTSTEPLLAAACRVSCLLSLQSCQLKLWVPYTHHRLPLCDTMTLCMCK